MNVAEHEAAEREAHAAAHSEIFSDLRTATPLGRLNLVEVRAVLHQLAERGFTIVKAKDPATAKAQLAAL